MATFFFFFLETVKFLYFVGAPFEFSGRAPFKLVTPLYLPLHNFPAILSPLSFPHHHFPTIISPPSFPHHHFPTILFTPSFPHILFPQLFPVILSLPSFPSLTNIFLCIVSCHPFYAILQHHHFPPAHSCQNAPFSPFFFFWAPLKRDIPKSYLFWCIFLNIFRKVTCFDVPFSKKIEKLPVLMYLSQDSPKSYLFWCTFLNKFRKVRYLFWCTFLNKFRKVICFDVPFSINSEKLPVKCTFL